MLMGVSETELSDQIRLHEVYIFVKIHRPFLCIGRRWFDEVYGCFLRAGYDKLVVL